MQREPDKQGWQTIDTAPKDGTHILGFYVSRAGETGVAEIWRLWDWDDEIYEDQYIGYLSDACECRADVLGTFTHWMPLPAPPETPDAA